MKDFITLSIHVTTSTVSFTNPLEISIKHTCPYFIPSVCLILQKSIPLFKKVLLLLPQTSAIPCKI